MCGHKNNNYIICNEPFKTNWTNIEQDGTSNMFFMFVKVDNRYRECG